MDLHELLRRHEGKTLEFKRNLDGTQGVLRTLVAFANTAGGTLLIGIEDGSRQVLGVTDPLPQEERLANLLSDNIQPRLVPDIELLPWRDTHILAVIIHPSPNRPHHLVREGPEQGTYVRVGSSNRHADAALVAEMRRYALGESFDEQPLPELEASAVDFHIAYAAFADVRKFKDGDLDTLRLVTRHQGKRVPTIGGLLLFGPQRLEQFPDAWLQLGRFRGTDKSHIADQLDLHLYPIQALQDAQAFVMSHIQRGAEIGALKRKDRWTLPPIAVREALINAVVHADYSQRGAPIRVALYDDRLEIENPGLLPFGLQVEDLRRGISRLRNRVLGRVFHELGLIEQWGSGIQRMQNACIEAGLPPPRLEEIGTRFRVTLSLLPEQAPQLDTLDQAIMNLLGDGQGHSTAEVAKYIQRTPRATRTRLLALIERGLIVEVGASPSDPQRRYYLVNPA